MRRKFVILVFLILFLSLSIIVFAAAKDKDIQKSFTFDEQSPLKEWQEKIFKGKTFYELDKANHDTFVAAKSENAASGYFYRISYSSQEFPMMSWKWKILKFPEKGGPENAFTAKKDDFAARIYVVFPSGSFLTSKCIEYIWDEFEPVGTIKDSPYSKNIKLWVLETGKEKMGQWLPEERNVYEDYKTAYGNYPKLTVGAIAFMTDTDSNETTAEAAYDDIKVGYKKPGEEAVIEDKKEE